MARPVFTSLFTLALLVQHALCDSDWGTYNPGAFIGLRSKLTKVPEVEELEVGVVWGNSKKLRHNANDDSVAFTYLYNDPGNFAVQRIKDPQFALELNSTFISDAADRDSFELTLEGQHVGKSKYDVKPHTLSLFFYFKFLRQVEGCAFKADGSEWALVCNGKTLSKFAIEQADGRHLSYTGLKVATYNLPHVSKFIVNSLQEIPELTSTFSNSIQPSSNLLLIQVIVQAPFQVKLRYNNPQSIADLDSLVSAFLSRVTEKFGSFPDDKRAFGVDVLSNLLGGIGIYNGPIRVKSLDGVETEQKMKLFTGSPSRNFYPRGFLWDEGFHLLTICQWREDLCIEILTSWLKTMDDRGWIAREQIRGYDAEERVPKEFLVQSKDIANPPALLLSITKLLDKVRYLPPEIRNNNSIFKALKEFFPSLHKWFHWLQATQKNKDGAPMWKGRSMYHNLASGLDDYPRGLMPSDLERHLDLQCWLIFFADSLKTLASLIGEDEEAITLEQTLEAYRGDLKKLFWDEKKQKYSDFLGEQFMKGEWPAHVWREDNKCGQGQNNAFGEPAMCNPYSDAPCCSKFGWCGNGPQFCSCEGCQPSKKLENFRDFKKEQSFSPHEGYVSLFPLIIGEAEADSPAFTSMISLIESPNKLWSDHGLRSLSASDLLYKQGEGYWRGPIWFNLNYLVWRALKLHYPSNAQAQALAESLRENLVDTVFKDWKKSGQLWEQYNDTTGKGQRVRPFYGWTSLVLLIMQDLP
mmetsp:Transcript_15242/g.27795  ORF Transcript_15242/g.27795 Transcript_15242/m.27795 type:complete len:750 (+) Transcript_15242:126-2375(+)